jgi:hypothetical protein
MARQKLRCQQVQSDGNRERQLVSRAVLEIQDSNDENDPLTRAAMVLVGAAFVGPNVDRLVQLTGYPLEYVDQIATRLRASDLWQDGTLNYDPWDDEEKGFVAFILDLEVASGRFVRKGRTASGQYKFGLVKEADNTLDKDEVVLRSRRRFRISPSALRGRFRQSPFDIYPNKKEK